MFKKIISWKTLLAGMAALFSAVSPAFASEANLAVPCIRDAGVAYDLFGLSITSYDLLIIGLVISVIGCIFGFVEFLKVKKIEVHKKHLLAIIWSSSLYHIFLRNARKIL